MRKSPYQQIELLIGATQFHICFQIIVVADVSGGQDDIYLGPNNVKGPNQGTYVPLTVFFHNTTFQGGTNGFHFGGAQNLIIDGGHSEQTPTPFLITYDSGDGGASNQNIVITHNYIAGTSATTAVITDNDQFSVANFADNLVFGLPPAFVTGTNPANVYYCGNRGWTGSMGCALQKSLSVNGLNIPPTGNTGSSLIQSKRAAPGCTTAASVGATCSTTVTWTTAFPAASYSVSCEGDGAITNFPTMGSVTARTATTATVQTMALKAAAASFATIDCAAMHD
jgi:hypothetical protein